MSLRVQTAVWEHSKAVGNERLMLLAIADFADDDGRAFPSVAKLAAMCRLQVRGAQRLIAVLRDSGELEVQINAGPKGCNVYVVKVGNPLHGDAPPTLHDRAPLHNGAPLHGGARGGAQPCAKPLHGDAPEPSLNHHEPPSIVRSGAKSKQSKAEHPLFAEFYAAYPRKVARPAALKAFRTLNPDGDTLQAMLAAIQTQGLGERCRTGEAQFVPHPATWLNGRRWEDASSPESRLRPNALRRPALHADDLLELPR